MLRLTFHARLHNNRPAVAPAKIFSGPEVIRLATQGSWKIVLQNYNKTKRNI